MKQDKKIKTNISTNSITKFTQNSGFEDFGGDADDMISLASETGRDFPIEDDCEDSQNYFQDCIVDQKVPEVLNRLYCEPILKFYFVIDQVPELNWEDGSQQMVLRCGKHLSDSALLFQIGQHNYQKVQETKYQKKKQQKVNTQKSNEQLLEQNSDIENEVEYEDIETARQKGANLYLEILQESQDHQQCRLTIRLFTTAEGFWNLNENAEEHKQLYHQPPVAKTTRYFKKLKVIQKCFNSDIGDKLLNQQANSFWDNPKNAFEDEFNSLKIEKFNQKI